MTGVKVEDIEEFLRVDAEEYKSMIEILKSEIMSNVLKRRDKVILNKEKTISKGNMLSLLWLLEIFHDSKIIPPQEVLDPIDLKNPESFSNYFDEVNQFFLNYEEIESSYVSNYLYKCIDSMSIFSSQNVLYQQGSTLSLFDIIQIYKKYPRFKELMTNEIPEDEIPSYTVSDLTQLQKDIKNEAIDIILNDDSPHNPFRDYIKSGSGINLNQFVECFLVIMYKPDTFGDVIPLPIQTSFSKGIKSISQYYIDCIGCRTALIISKVQVRQAGYFNRKVSSAVINSYLDYEVKDCGSKHYVKYSINDKDKFKLILNRYIVLDDGELYLVTKKDTNLIGTTVNLRSPITCACKGHDTCRTCYGELAQINKDLHIGIIANLTLNEMLTQKLLSTKHTLMVTVDNMSYSKQFLEALDVNIDRFVPLDDDTNIIINKEDLQYNPNSFRNRYSVENFYSQIRKKKISPRITSPTKLIISDKLSEDLDVFYDEASESYIFNNKNIEGKDDYLFKIIITNNGVADPLIEIKNTLERNSFIVEKAGREDYSMVVNHIVDNLVESKTMVNSVHIEVILSSMIYVNDKDDRSVFKDPDANINVNMGSLNDVILKYSKSPIHSLLYQYIDKQIKNDGFGLFFKKGKSNFDSILK